MPLTIRKRFKILPGVYLNVNRKSVSLTTRVGPVSQTVSTSGRRTTSVNLPGKGVGWRTTSTSGSREARREAKRARLQARLDAARARRGGRDG